LLVEIKNYKPSHSFSGFDAVGQPLSGTDMAFVVAAGAESQRAEHVFGGGPVVEFQFGFEPVIEPGTAYFLAGEKRPAVYKNFTFVVPIKDPVLIADARRQVSELALNQRSNFVFRIQNYADGINRNYSAPGIPEWPWHIIELVRFGAYVFGDMIPFPAETESEVLVFPRVFGFNDSYTLLKELPAPFPIVLSSKREGTDLLLEWDDRNGWFHYRLESADVASLEWQVISGPSPISVRQWRVPLNAISPGTLFRVRATLPANEPEP
jgi:hypothetical protein